MRLFTGIELTLLLAALLFLVCWGAGKCQHLEHRAWVVGLGVSTAFGLLIFAPIN